jgi:hypothetical protein
MEEKMGKILNQDKIRSQLSEIKKGADNVLFQFKARADRNKASAIVGGMVIIFVFGLCATVIYVIAAWLISISQPKDISLLGFSGGLLFFAMTTFRQPPQIRILDNEETPGGEEPASHPQPPVDRPDLGGNEHVQPAAHTEAAPRVRVSIPGSGNGGQRGGKFKLPKFKKPASPGGWILLGVGGFILVAVIIVSIAMSNKGGPGAVKSTSQLPIQSSVTVKPTMTKQVKTPTAIPEPTATKGPPPTPEPGSSVDAGSAPWKSDQQWIQIFMFIALLPLLVVNAFQKYRHPDGGSRNKRQSTQIIVAPILALLAFLIFIGTNWEVIKPFLLVSQPDQYKVAIIYWLILSIFAVIVGKDLAYAGLTLGAPALAYLVAAGKDFGILGALLKLDKNAAVYNFKITGDLLSVKSTASTADLSIAIYVMLFIAVIIMIVDIGIYIYQERSFGASIALIVGIGGGLLVYGIGKWISAPWTIAILMGGVALSAIGSKEEWDEGIEMAIFFSTILVVGLGEPLVKVVAWLFGFTLA